MKQLSKTVSTEIEKNKSWIARGGAIVLLVVVLAAASTVIWTAVTAGVGLLALGVVGIVGVGLFQALPAAGQWFENKMLSLRKAEARKNPIEQLQNFFRQKSEQLEAFKQATRQIGGQIKSLEDFVAERKIKKPDADTRKQVETIAAMKTAHKALVEKYNRGCKALEQLHDKIDEHQFEWNFAQAGGAAIAALNATSGEALIAEMLSDEASRSVRDNFNQVFADLEMEAQRINSGNALQIEGSSATFDTSNIQIPQFDKLVKAR